MKSLESGERVIMTRKALKQGLGVRGDTKGPCYGTVIEPIGKKGPLSIKVLRDGLSQANWYHHKFWRRPRAGERYAMLAAREKGNE